MTVSRKLAASHRPTPTVNARMLQLGDQRDGWSPGRRSAVYLMRQRLSKILGRRRHGSYQMPGRCAVDTARNEDIIEFITRFVRGLHMYNAFAFDGEAVRLSVACPHPVRFCYHCLLSPSFPLGHEPTWRRARAGTGRRRVHCPLSRACRHIENTAGEDWGGQ